MRDPPTPTALARAYAAHGRIWRPLRPAPHAWPPKAALTGGVGWGAWGEPVAGRGRGGGRAWLGGPCPVGGTGAAAGFFLGRHEHTPAPDRLVVTIRASHRPHSPHTSARLFAPRRPCPPLPPALPPLPPPPPPTPHHGRVALVRGLCPHRPRPRAGHQLPDAGRGAMAPSVGGRFDGGRP